jgi:nucleoside-diphosphate-sugar epimerase
MQVIGQLRECNRRVAYNPRVDILVLGGTHHVGRSVVEAALVRGHSVATVTRGVSGPPAAGARALHADRLDREAVEHALGTGHWTAVIDTWSRAPKAVQDTAQMLAGRTEHYCYISSRSVYRWPIPVGRDESAPVVDAQPGSSEDSDYARCKRGGELAAVEAFGERALLARAGLILGPYERVGRLPWWLRRVQRAGRVLCPGPPTRGLQYIDGRDLAEWILTMAERGEGGIFNTVSEPGHTTMGELLEAAVTIVDSTAELVWVPPSVIEKAGIAPWTELPIWVPPDGELAGLHAADVSAAYARGLRCRPVADTVADTWAWLQAEGDPPVLSDRAIGLAPEREAEVLAALR